MNQMMTVPEAARYLRMSRAQMYAMIQKKKIPYIRLSERRIVIRQDDLEKWIESRRQEARS